MSYNNDLLQRISKVSSDSSEYIEIKLSLDDQISDYELLSTCLGYIINELKVIGIIFPINIEDILDNSNYINAIISIREYFDYNIFLDSISNNLTSIMRLESISLSNDILDEDIFSNVFDLCTHLNIGDRSKLNNITYIVEHTSSTNLLRSYLTRIISELPITSGITDDQLTTYTTLLPHIETICMTWNRVLSHLLNSVKGWQEGYPDYLVSKYLDMYISQWRDPKNAERYSWIIQNGNNSDLQLEKIHHELLQTHWENNPGNLVHYIKKGPMTEIKGMSLFSCIIHEVILFLASRKRINEDTAKLFVTSYFDHKNTDIRISHTDTLINKRFINILNNLHVLLGVEDDNRYMQRLREACMSITQIDPFSKIENNIGEDNEINS